MDKTLSCLQERFYWPGYHDDVRNWCNSCMPCAARKNPIPKPRAPLTSKRKDRIPHQLVAVDILGPFPESDAGNNYILVGTDYFTRWTEAYPIRNEKATTVARKLTDEFFFRFSPPDQLHSDQGHNFESEVIAEICKLLAIKNLGRHPTIPSRTDL